MKTNDYGSPQRRNRLYIIGIKKVIQKRKFHFPEQVLYRLSIDDILESKQKQKHFQTTKIKQELLRQKKKQFNIKSNDNWTIDLNASYFYSVPIQNESMCLLTTCSMIYLTKYNRYLTVRECLRLQGFPDDFNLISHNYKAYKQIGNSMSVNVLCFLFIEIFKSII